MNILQFVVSLSLALLAYAQTQTIVDQYCNFLGLIVFHLTPSSPRAGNSVVVVATIDPAGAPLTQTM